MTTTSLGLIANFIIGTRLAPDCMRSANILQKLLKNKKLDDAINQDQNFTSLMKLTRAGA